MNPLLVFTAALLVTAPLLSIAQQSSTDQTRAAVRAQLTPAEQAGSPRQSKNYYPAPSGQTGGQAQSDQSGYGGTATTAESSSQQGGAMNRTPSTNRLFAHH